VVNIHILGPGLITNGGENAFSAGVFLLLVANSEVSGITVLGSGNGIVAGESSFLTITANTLGRNVIGMNLGNAFLSTISENDVSGNGIGIAVVNDVLSTLGTVSHNIINGNTDGVSIFSAEGGATFQNNAINGNGQYGISVVGPGPTGVVRNVEITNNTSLADGNFDMFDGSAVCAGTVWSGNKFFTANQSCIH